MKLAGDCAILYLLFEGLGFVPQIRNLYILKKVKEEKRRFEK